MVPSVCSTVTSHGVDAWSLRMLSSLTLRVVDAPGVDTTVVVAAVEMLVFCVPNAPTPVDAKQLDELGIRPSFITGTSIGALYGAAYAAGLSAALVQLLTSPADYARAIEGAEAFYAEHGGATAKHMATLVPWLEAA